MHELLSVIRLTLSVWMYISIDGEAMISMVVLTLGSSMSNNVPAMPARVISSLHTHSHS